MADRLGTRGGVVRPNRTGTIGVGGSIGVPAAGGGASSAWAILARNAEGVAQETHQIYDRTVAAQATEAGTLDAINGRVRRLDRSTTRGGAYMDAALETTGVIANTNALVALSDFYQQNPNDPAALQQAISDYADGAAGELMALDPASAVQLRSRILTHALPMINAAVENREQATAAAKKEAQLNAEGALQSTIARNSGSLFDPDSEMRRAASTAMFDAIGSVQSLQSESAVDGYLLQRLTSGHDAAHIINMQPELKTRLAAMIEGAPDDIKAGLGIFSGYRSIERQRQLYEASDKSGRMVARPGHSMHNHGQAADLAFNGASLADAPEYVQKWVHDHAADYGLKFPMEYEPWHIEVQETRGGARFEGSVSFDGSGPKQQEINDAVIVPGFRAWFSRQTDKTQAFLDYVEGKTELPMTLPDGREVVVNIRRTLSDKAATDLQADLYSLISQEHTLREQGEKDSAADAARVSNETRLGFMTGIIANGQEMQVGGQTVRAAKPTEGELLDAVNQGLLEPDDYEDLLKALRSPPAVASDPEVERGLFQMIATGQDPSDFIMANIAHLTADDAKKWLDYWGAKQNATGSLNSTQKFYLDQIEKSFTQGAGGMDKYDENKQERMVSSVTEARERMLAGEKPQEVFADIHERSKFSLFGDAAAGLSPPVPRPRFSVPDPANPQFIDLGATSVAIDKAYKAKQISQEQYLLQRDMLLDYADWQEKQAAGAQ